MLPPVLANDDGKQERGYDERGNGQRQQVAQVGGYGRSLARIVVKQLA
ncbi:MAG: hypothetical protein H6669_07875 [Ardenticatenaceae bacterium]|nr:hypothetical protein [Ardenticatenaceae bacterium]